MIKSIILSTIRKISKMYFRFVYDNANKKYLKQIAELNGIDINTAKAGEEEWKKRWTVLSSNIDILNYRLFSHYIGANMDIYPANISLTHIEPILNPTKYVPYYEDKNMFDIIYGQNNTVGCICRLIGGGWQTPDYQHISSITDYFDSVSKDIEAIIIKPSVETGSGKGVEKYSKLNTQWISSSGKLLCWEQINELHKGNAIVQRCFTQSRFMSSFNSSSVNTIRVFTYKSVINNEVNIIPGCIRFGSSGSVIDNLHAGGGMVGFDEDGILSSYTSDQYGRKGPLPQSVLDENITVIPNWPTIKQFAIDMASKEHHHRLLALDICLDIDDTPKIIEINIGQVSWWIPQFFGHPFLGKFTNEIIEYLQEKNENISGW